MQMQLMINNAREIYERFGVESEYAPIITQSPPAPALNDVLSSNELPISSLSADFFSSAQPHNAEHLKVLLIEDDRTTQRIVRAKLRDYCDLRIANTASDGATVFRTEHPDLTLIDIELPDGNGHFLLNWMLKTRPDTYAVMFSGHSDNNNVWRSVKNGAKGFVSKPFDIGKMMFFINQCRYH